MRTAIFGEVLRTFRTLDPTSSRHAEATFDCCAARHAFITGCGRSGPNAEAAGQEREVVIRIDSDGRLFIEGDRVAMWYLERQISRMLRDEKAVFVISAAPGTPMGVLNDVQRSIPGRNVAGIRYTDPNG
jgi:hypothetical protein